MGSLFVCSFFSVARIAKTNLDRLQKVQNREIRSIYRLEWTSPTDLIHSILYWLEIEIGKKYLPKAVGNNSNVCLLLVEYLDSISSIRRKEKYTPPCIFHQHEWIQKFLLNWITETFWACYQVETKSRFCLFFFLQISKTLFIYFSFIFRVLLFFYFLKIFIICLVPCKKKKNFISNLLFLFYMINSYIFDYLVYSIG
jgi:hypothetical protein